MLGHLLGKSFQFVKSVLVFLLLLQGEPCEAPGGRACACALIVDLYTDVSVDQTSQHLQTHPTHLYGMVFVTTLVHTRCLLIV